MVSQKLSRCRMWMSSTRISAVCRNEGYALLSTMLVAYILLMLGLAVISLAVYDNKTTDRWRKSSEAYFMARTAKQIPLPFEPGWQKKKALPIFDDPAFMDNRTAPVHRWVPWIAGLSGAFVDSVTLAKPSATATAYRSSLTMKL